MTLKSLMAAAVSLVASAAAGAASAAVVWSSVPDLTVTPSVDAWCSSCGGSYEPLDQFNLAAPAQITGFDLVALNAYGYNAVQPITFDVYNADHSALVFSEIVIPSFVQATGRDDAIVTASVSGLDLGSGTYWASFRAFTFGVPGFSNGGNGSLIDTTPGTGVESFQLGGNTGYQLLGVAGAVPEPSTWAVMLFGFGGLGAAIRMRRRGAMAAA
jgi:hypothetical protein